MTDRDAPKSVGDDETLDGFASRDGVDHRPLAQGLVRDAPEGVRDGFVPRLEGEFAHERAGLERSELQRVEHLLARRDDEVAADAGEEFHVAGKLRVDAHDAFARVDQRNLLHDALPHATLELERGVIVLSPGVEFEVDESNVVLGRQHHLARVRSRIAQVQREFHVVIPRNPKLARGVPRGSRVRCVPWWGSARA